MDETMPVASEGTPGRVLRIISPEQEEIEFRKKLYPDVSEIENAKILCTICQKDVKHIFLLKNKSYKHVFLRVIVCKGCLKFYQDGEFSLDEDGDDKYCRWCGQGGTLCLCSCCSSTFCKKCIRANLERKYLLLVDRDDWKCFFCDPKPLYKLRALCWAVDEHLANIKKKEEAQKLKAEKKSATNHKVTTFVRIEKPEYPKLDVDHIPSEHVTALKSWMSDISSMASPDFDNRSRLWSQCRDNVLKMKEPQDVLSAASALEKFIETDIDRLLLARKQFIDGLAKFKEEHRKNDANVVDSKVEKLDSVVNGVVQSGSIGHGEEILLDDGADMGKRNGNEDETRPKIRLKNISDLMEPKLKNGSLSDKKEVPSSKIKTETPIGSSTPKLSSKTKSKPTRKKSVELITLSSDDSDVVCLPKSSSKKAQVKSLKDEPKKKTDVSRTSNDEPVRLFTFSEDEEDGEPKKKTDVSRTSNFGNASKDMFLSDSEPENEKSPAKNIPRSSSPDTKSKEKEAEKEGISLKENDKNPSREMKSGETSKIDNACIESDSDSSSSSDPLSGSSSDEKKKKTSKKVNRSYFTDTDDEGSIKRKSNIKTPKKQVRKETAFESSSSDSDSDAKKLLKKRTKTSTAAKKSAGMKEKSKSKSKTVVSASDDDSLDMDIEKLCNLKSLQPKRGRSSSDLSESSSDHSAPDDETKEKKRSSMKAKRDVDKLSDFYDSADDQQRDSGDFPEEDLETTFEKVLPEYNLESVVHEDIRTAILNMSSSSDKEQKPGSSEDESSEKKSKSERKKSRKERADRERTKGKKKYADKLMEMNIDSDSDDMEKGEEKYAKLKEKRAAKSDHSHSDEDDSPIVKKKVVAKRKAKPRKKMFSDSDESSIEDESDKKQSEKEDSEEEDEKKKKKKKAASDSNSSDEETKTPTKKRRRIKKGSDSSNSDSDGGGKRDKSVHDSSSKGRKSIRRILKEDDLKQTTQAALKQEQERKKRIAEKQKLYNAMVEVSSETHKELTELVLDFNPKTKEKVVVVDPTLVKKLKPHQAEGIKFMWDSCFETLEMAKTKSGSGCILAHCMGLGKSLQVVTLIHTLLAHPEIGVRTVLVVAPVSTVLNWANEFDKWLKDVGSGQDVNVFHMTRCQANHRAFMLKDWSRQGGVLIMGYNLLRTLSNPKTRVKNAFKKVFQEKLVDPGPDVVVCDEGHILKNEKTAISITMSKMKTRRRIVLTGTPLQNNLVEYHCMVQFVKPSLLGTKKEFTNRFVNPIQNGQFEDSTPHDVKIMKRRAHVLHTMLDGLVQRKDYNVLTPYLPPKFEYVIHLKLSDVQVKLYRYYLLNMVQRGDSDQEAAPKGKRLFVDFQHLMWICLHPRTLLMKSVKDEKKAEMEFDDSDEEGSLKEFIDDGSDSSSSDFKTSSSESDKSESEKEKSKPARRKTRGQGSVSDVEEEPVKQWWSELIEDEQMDDIRQSSKLFLFFTILKYCEEIGDKLLVFSQSLYTLDLLEYFLDKIDEESQKPEEERIPGIKGFEGSWAKGLDYFRLDGSSACENREAWCKSFNRKDNVRARLFLISTRAGGLGINLTGANRVIIFDASWNPSFDVQSLFRVYRFGQEKPCYIYRFLSKGTMEEKIYERQVAKLSTALRVIDEQQIDRHFSHSALAELYMFDPEGSELRGTPVLPKDRLMAELLQNHSDIILSHHQHDSLLENQEDQELSEEERKAAWAEFENEKNQKPPVFQNTNMMGTLVSMMMEIRTKLKMQNPAWTEDQLRMGALQILQQYPDFKSMVPYLGMLFQQQQLQQQQLQQQFQGQVRSGLPMMSNPQFPGGGMVFPNFQYPMYNSNVPQMNNLTAGRLNNVGQMSQPGQVNNVGQVQNKLLENLLQPNITMNSNSLLVNPKHAAQNSQPKITSVQSLQKVQPPVKTASTGAGSSTDPINLDDSGPIELKDD